MIVMSEVGKVSAQIVDMEVQAEKYGWDSRYGRMHVQLNVKKARLRYVLLEKEIYYFCCC